MMYYREIINNKVFDYTNDYLVAQHQGWTDNVLQENEYEKGHDGNYYLVGYAPSIPTLHEQALQITMPKFDFMRLAVALTNQTEGMTGLTFEYIEQMVNAYIGEASAQVRMGFQYDMTISRNNPLLDVMAQYFEIPNFSELLDLIFVNHVAWLAQLDRGEPIG